MNLNAAKSTQSRLGESHPVMFDSADTSNIINTEQSLLIAPNYSNRIFVFRGTQDVSIPECSSAIYFIMCLISPTGSAYM